MGKMMDIETMLKNKMKQQAALAALALVVEDAFIGVGTGSTVNYFIEALVSIKHKIAGAIASSLETKKRLMAHGIPVVDLNSTDDIPIYIDGAD